MKIKIGVFFGGRSVEHEVSIISALQAITFFDKEKYDIIPIYITKENEMYVGEYISKIEEYTNLTSLLKKSKRVILVPNSERVDIVRYPFKKLGNNIYDYIDVAFPIVHGTNVEDGCLQGYFKTLGIPFMGCDVLSSAVGMDKYVMKTVLKDSGLPILDCLSFNNLDYSNDKEDMIKKIEETIEYPVIVKPINLGSSVGIKIARDQVQLIEAIDYAFEFAHRVLVERAIMNLREINCSVLGDYEEAIASECEEPISTDEILSYEDKYIGSGSKEGTKNSNNAKRKLPADISDDMKEQIQSLAIKTFRALGCNGVSRIDLMIDTKTGEIFVNEINTIPGLLSFHLWDATNLKYRELLNRLVELTLKRNREEKSISYSFDTNILDGITLNGTKGAKGTKIV